MKTVTEIMDANGTMEGTETEIERETGSVMSRGDMETGKAVTEKERGSADAEAERTLTNTGGPDATTIEGASIAVTKTSVVDIVVLDLEKKTEASDVVGGSTVTG